MAERRPRCVLVRINRMRGTRTANTAISICQYILLTKYIYEDDLQLGKLKGNCFATQALSQTQKNVSLSFKELFQIRQT